MGVIRFLLALSVLIVHSSPLFGFQLLPGYLAVRSFYIISGFYMAFVYREKYSKTDRPFYDFYTNRFYRLYPLYILVVVLTIVLSIGIGLFSGHYGSLQTYFNQYHQNQSSLPSLLVLLATNLTLIGQDLISFFSISANGSFRFNGLQSNITIQSFLFVPIAWTISIELFFYLLTPYLSSRSLKLNIVVGLLVLILMSILFFVAEKPSEFMIYRFAPTELFWFLIGIISYKLNILRFEKSRRLPLFLFLAVISLLLLYRFICSDWLVGVVIFITTPSIFYYFQKSKVDRFIGELTYPLYISHTFFLMIVSANRFPKDFGTGIPTLLLSIFFSFLAYKYFQKPIDEWRMKRLHLDKKNLSHAKNH